MHDACEVNKNEKNQNVGVCWSLPKDATATPFKRKQQICKIDLNIFLSRHFVSQCQNIQHTNIKDKS